MNILNGDGLAEKFPSDKIPGEITVVRECLIEGPVNSDDLNEFFDQRSEFIEKIYSEIPGKYFDKVVSEFEKFKTIPENSEVNLWFENDLYCQANMWFVISQLTALKDLYLYRVIPELKIEDQWCGFGNSTEYDLLTAYKSRVSFERDDLQLGSDLWDAYRKNDLKNLKQLSVTKSPCFPYLREVIEAHLQRFADKDKLPRPEQTLSEILNEGYKDFRDAFREFQHRDGIYGFSDLQVKAMLESLQKK